MNVDNYKVELLIKMLAEAVAEEVDQAVADALAGCSCGTRAYAVKDYSIECDEAELRVLVAAWLQVYGEGTLIKAGEVAQLIRFNGPSGAKHGYKINIPIGEGQAAIRTTATMLRAMVGNTYDGYTVESRTRSNQTKYRLERV